MGRNTGNRNRPQQGEQQPGQPTPGEIKKPFLHVITRTYQRPGFLKQNQEALVGQTDPDFFQEILVDEDGIGVAKANQLLRDVEAKGLFVYVLDDDDVVTDPQFIEKLKAVVATAGEPGLVAVNAQVGDKLLPLNWPPNVGEVGNINIISSAATWEAHRAEYGARHEGDWDYVNAVLSVKPPPLVEFISGMTAMALRVSNGAPEIPEKQKPEDLKLGRQVGVGSLKTGMRVRMVTSIAGPHFSYEDGKVLTVTSENVNHVEDLLRAGVASEIRE